MSKLPPNLFSLTVVSVEAVARSTDPRRKNLVVYTNAGRMVIDEFVLKDHGGKYVEETPRLSATQGPGSQRVDQDGAVPEEVGGPA